MNLSASIVDQRISGIIEEHSDLLGVGRDEDKKKSAAFVLLCMSTVLDLSIEEAAELLTEGGNDAGVDGLHIGEMEDGEFTVTLFQGKYKTKDLSGTPNFPENGVQKACNTVATLFDPLREIDLNPRIAPKVQEIRSLVRDGYIPNVCFILCNNGAKWKAQAQRWIDQAGFPPEQVRWQHFNHESIVAILKKTRPVNDILRFSGAALVESFNYRRVLMGKAQVSEIAALFDRHGDALLERNIRRYLGLHSNRVNTAIHEDPQQRENFYFFNNGITMTCSNFRHNALQGENYQVKLDSLQVINGGQTCKTIQQTLNEPNLFSEFDNTFVLVRIYELAEDDQDFVRDITYATNSQNPVDLRDLRSNDDLQRRLEIGLRDLGYTYKRQREEAAAGPNAISSSTVAEAVLAVWRERPHQAKFRRKEHFGKLYNEIFDGLNAAQAIIAVHIFKNVEKRRKSSHAKADLDFIPYASHYVALLIGRQLLDRCGLAIDQVTHKNIEKITRELENFDGELYDCALEDIGKALEDLYGRRKISLQQLSATFRRGDLMAYLPKKPRESTDY